MIASDRMRLSLYSYSKAYDLGFKAGREFEREQEKPFVIPVAFIVLVLAFWGGIIWLITSVFF